jgi:hypothetical protein
MLRTGIAVFSLGIGSAYAGDSNGNSATTLFASRTGGLRPPAVSRLQLQPLRPRMVTRQSRVLTPTRRAKARGCPACFRYRGFGSA